MMMLMQDTDYIDVIWDLRMNFVRLNQLIYKKSPQYLWELLLNGESPVDFQSLGRWWGNDPIQKQQTEIDIMGEQDKTAAVFAECKWTNEKVDLAVLETLKNRSMLFRHEKKHLFLFSKTGFTDACENRALELGNVSLVTYENIAETLLHI